MSYRIMVTGSRDWSWPISKMQTFLSEYLKEAGVDPKDATLVHGAARGADKTTAQAAENLGMKSEAHIADWVLNGKAAGFIRNVEMINTNPNVVLAFQRNKSKGTQHAIDLATKKGIPVIRTEHND